MRLRRWFLSLPIAVLEKFKGRKFVALVNFPTPEILPEGSGQTLAILSLMLSAVWWQISIWFESEIKGIPTKFIIGDTLQNNEVSSVVYGDFLPQALAEGKYLAAPEPFVVGHGLEYIKKAFDRGRALEGSKLGPRRLTYPLSKSRFATL